MSPNRPSRFLVKATVLLLSLIWGTTWAAIRIGLEGIPPFTGVALRFAIASAVLLVLGRITGVQFGQSRREKILWFVNGILSFCISYGVIYWCEQWVPSGLASVLFATFPLFVAILAHFLLPEEPLNGRVLGGILLGFGGVAVIFSEDLSGLGGPHVALGSVVMLSSPLVAAVSNVAIKRWGAGVHYLSLTAVPMGICAVVMGIVALLTEHNQPFHLTHASVGALLYLALAGSALTFSLYYWLLSHLPATRLSLITYMTPVMAVSVGALFLHEPYTLRALAGSALVVAGVALSTHRFRWRAIVVALLLAPAGAARAGSPLRLPADPAPEAVESLGSLEGMECLAVSEDGSRAAVAIEVAVPGKKTRSLVRLSAGPGQAPRSTELDGAVRAMLIAEDSLYAVVHREPTKWADSGETALARIALDSLKILRMTRVPLGAPAMALMAGGESLLIASRNDLRVLLIPDLTSQRLFRVTGENLAVAALPGGNRVLVGQPNALLLVDLSDPQSRDGLPVRERLQTPAPVHSLVASPDGTAALARLIDGRTYSVLLDPLRLADEGVASAIAWPGARAAYERPVAPAGETPPPEAKPEIPPPPAPTTVEPEKEEKKPTAEVSRDESAAPPREQEVKPPPPPEADLVESTAPPAPLEKKPELPTVPPPAPAELAPQALDRTGATIRGRITGPAAGEVRSVVVLGPNNLLREAVRASPSPDGSWSAGLVPEGTYRVVVDAGGDRVAVSDPPFATVTVGREPVVEAPDLHVVSIRRP